MTNDLVAECFFETARLLENQGANPFRVRAYRHAAETLRRLRQPVEQILGEEGPAGLERLPGIGPGLAAAICSYVATGRMPLQERLTRTRSPFGELTTVPGIGCLLAHRIHEKLEIATLEPFLESALATALTSPTQAQPGVVVAPDAGAIKLAQYWGRALNLPTALFTRSGRERLCRRTA
jgi:DNA polymerase/3'-5' exonuclease PolX